MSFNKWKDEYGLEFEPNYSKETESDCNAAFKAGQQSKQNEVDRLQKRIDRAVGHIEDYYGVVELSMIVDILKGEETK